jgi:hypothetical protein
MGSKNKPGKFDCYANAMPDEPMFVLLARDPEFYSLVSEWAKRRALDIACGDRPQSDQDLVDEAYQCANDGARWRRMNNGAWRTPQDTEEAP